MSLCDTCDGEGWVWRHELPDTSDWDGSADDTKYSCHDCIFCNFCNQNIMYDTNEAFCNKCNVSYFQSNEDVIIMYQSKDKDWHVAVDMLFKTSIIGWFLDGNYYNIPTPTYPKHPDELNEFVKKHLKVMILK